jgi:hypothetical protein
MSKFCISQYLFMIGYARSQIDSQHLVIHMHSDLLYKSSLHVCGNALCSEFAVLLILNGGR